MCHIRSTAAAGSDGDAVRERERARDGEKERKREREKERERNRQRERREKGREGGRKNPGTQSSGRGRPGPPRLETATPVHLHFKTAKSRFHTVKARKDSEAQIPALAFRYKSLTRCKVFTPRSDAVFERVRFMVYGSWFMGNG